MPQRAREIPQNINELNLNLRAFLDPLPSDSSLYERVEKLVVDIERGKYNRETGTAAFLRILARHEEDLLAMVKAALPGGKNDFTKV